LQRDPEEPKPPSRTSCATVSVASSSSPECFSVGSVVPQESSYLIADALALVRKESWAQEEETFCGLPADTETAKIPEAFHEGLTDALCYAA
jgi:hypothetical protein